LALGKEIRNKAGENSNELTWDRKENKESPGGRCRKNKIQHKALGDGLHSFGRWEEEKEEKGREEEKEKHHFQKDIRRKDAS